MDYMQKADWDSYKRLCEDTLSYGNISYGNIGKSTDSIAKFSITQQTKSKAIKGLHPGSLTHVIWQWLKGKHIYTNKPTNLNLTN